MQLQNGMRLYEMTLSLGDDLDIWFGRKHLPNCRLIKVTRKGFNILNLDTDRVILRRHLYAKGMVNTEYPSHGTIRGKFLISEYFRVTVKPRQKELAS